MSVLHTHFIKDFQPIYKTTNILRNVFNIHEHILIPEYILSYSVTLEIDIYSIVDIELLILLSYPVVLPGLMLTLKLDDLIIPLSETLNSTSYRSKLPFEFINIDIDIIGENDCILDLDHIIESNKKIKKLALCHYKISEPGLLQLRRSLQYDQTLTYLNLSHNNIQQGIDILGTIFEINHSIRRLNLTHCKIFGDDKFTIFCNKLQYNLTLVELNLNENILGFNGIKSITNLLSNNQTIQRISLAPVDWSPITHAGLDILCTMLRINSTLKYLDLSYAKIDDCGLNSLCDCLMHSTNSSTLMYLLLDGNRFHFTSTTQLLNLVKFNTTLKFISLKHCFLKAFPGIQEKLHNKVFIY